jgi:hypothetical protein
MEKERKRKSSAGFAFGATQNRVAKFFPTKKSHPADAYHLFSILFLVIFGDGKSVRGEPAQKFKGPRCKRAADEFAAASKFS